ncbi:hypothetical protein TraAM80_01013 [Trypanosoma rangeli]|uniref:Uncharacterized protein n=1 Tax=Trypanosoma rangeli TaxID=5698 RepID=A0A3R7M9B8_TRYRA|nr:uncharacterized protein TraAM80_01013 [Trypanosoma rangeli]RNF11396.1 hypothetical protein TraAM80_01013 [Trypanosoma rangeli]|eukprot:RNF11396.1 hypothetical protein TraAM80_01013 [Trypanosoma rangeli]
MLGKASSFLRWLTGGSPLGISESSRGYPSRNRGRDEKKRWQPHKEGVGSHYWLLAARNVLGWPLTSKAPQAAAEATRENSKEESLSLTKAVFVGENRRTTIVDAATARAVTPHHIEVAADASGEQPHDAQEESEIQLVSQEVRDRIVRDAKNILPLTVSAPINNAEVWRRGKPLHKQLDVIQLAESNPWTKGKIDIFLENYTFTRSRAASRVGVAAGDLRMGNQTCDFIAKGKVSRKQKPEVYQEYTNTLERRQGHKILEKKQPQEYIPKTNSVHEQTPEPAEVGGVVVAKDLVDLSEEGLSAVTCVLCSSQCGNEVQTVGSSSIGLAVWMYVSAVVVCAIVVTVIWVLVFRNSTQSRLGDGVPSMMRWQLLCSELVWEAAERRFALLFDALSARFEVVRAQMLCLRSIVGAYFRSCEMHYVDLGNSIVVLEDLEGDLREAEARCLQLTRGMKCSSLLHEVVLSEGQQRLSLCLEEQSYASQIWGHMLAVLQGQLEHFMRCKQARAAALVEVTPHTDAEKAAAPSRENDQSIDTQDSDAASSLCSVFAFAETSGKGPNEMKVVKLEELLRDMLLKENREKHALMLELQLLRSRFVECTKNQA